MTACYLDYNATTPLGLPAREAMARAMEAAAGIAGNASSVHGFGRAARKIVEDARAHVAELAGVAPANVIFTSGGSEANNAILRGIGADVRVTSSIEHASVLDAVEAVRAPVNADGVIDLNALAEMLNEVQGRVLISVMAANNETGVVQPIAEISALAKNHDAVLHVDAIQWAGKRPLFEVTAYADAVSLSAHKFGGPQGVGAILVKDGTAFAPLVRGGGQERRRRSGTENLIGIAGFGAAADAALTGVHDFAKLAGLRDRIESELGEVARIYGQNAERLPNTTCIAMPGVSAETQVMAFDLAGIAVSAGSACSSGKIEPSHVLLAMGLSDKDAAEAIRVSLGHGTTEQDVGRFIQTWHDLYSRNAKTAKSKGTGEAAA